MSGGHYDYIQYRFEEVADKIRRDGVRYDMPEHIRSRFEIAARHAELAAKMIQRVDWLLSGDDGEDSFIARWDAENLPATLQDGGEG